ncbi:MAG: hypothetical protein Q3M30_02665 [Candidatus Electrothrix sp. Rat3]|nr:hypothetical protein [Candidatus Electrothrix rattekaaiensis]
MAYQRKSSRVIAEALKRLANLKAIDPDLDLGNGLTVAAFETQINKTQTSENTYNGQLAQADAGGNNFRADEKDLRDMSSQMLSGVKVKYGRDSNEYEMAGGTRLSERKKPKKKDGEKSGGGGEGDTP